MENKYRLILEDFEGTTSISLEVFACHFPRKKELIRFEPDQFAAADAVLETFRAEYTVVEIEHKVNLKDGDYRSIPTVRAKYKSKLPAR